MSYTVHTKGHSEPAIPVVLALLVHLVVILSFFSLFLQFVLLQRIVDIYICILGKELVVPDDGGAPVGCFCLAKAHGGKGPANPGISEPAFFEFALIESARILGLEIGNNFDRKNAIFYLRF